MRFTMIINTSLINSVDLDHRIVPWDTVRSRALLLSVLHKDEDRSLSSSSHLRKELITLLNSSFRVPISFRPGFRYNEKQHIVEPHRLSWTTSPLLFPWPGMHNKTGFTMSPGFKYVSLFIKSGHWCPYG